MEVDIAINTSGLRDGICWQQQQRGAQKKTENGTAPEGPAYCRANPRSYRKTRHTASVSSLPVAPRTNCAQ